MYCIHANDLYVLMFHFVSLIHVFISFLNIQFSRYRSLLLVKYFLHGHHLLILPISKPSGEGLYNHLWHNKDVRIYLLMFN